MFQLQSAKIMDIGIGYGSADGAKITAAGDLFGYFLGFLKTLAGDIITLLGGGWQYGLQQCYFGF
jgi:hypothetical protein